MEAKKDIENHQTIVKAYKKRWLILGMFTLYCFANILHTSQYAVIADVVVKYYNVSYIAVNWVTMIFMIVYVLFSFPGNYISEKLGLRATILLGISGTCLGAWIKVIGVNPDRFYLIAVGQFILAICQVFVLPLPPKVAAIWFADKEISTACCLGVIATQLACAFSNVIPAVVVSQGDISVIEYGLHANNLGYAVFSTVLIPILFFFFSEKPPSVPSLAQLNILQNINNNTSTPNYMKSVKSLLSVKSYVIFTISYGIVIGCFYPFAVLSNQIILKFYPDASVDVGVIGLSALIACCIGSLVNGVLLDKFRRYKLTTYVVHYMFFIILVIANIFFTSGLIYIYITFIIAGFAFGNCLSNGFEVAIELTYPIAEEISGGIITCSTQLFAVTITLLYSYVFDSFGIYWANGMVSLLVLFANSMFFFIKFTLNRQEAANKEISKL